MLIITQVISTNAEYTVCEVAVEIPSCNKLKPFCMDDCQNKHGPYFIDAVCVGGYKCLCFFSSESTCPKNGTLHMY